MKLFNLMIVVLTSVFIGGIANGQSNLVQGSQTISLKYGGGLYSLGTYGQLDYGWCYREKFLLRGSVSYEYARIGTSRLNVGKVNLDNTYNLFSIGKRLYGNLVLGASIGTEAAYSVRNPIRESNFIFGGNLGIELDFFVLRKLSVKGEFLQHYMHRSFITPWYWTSSVGICYVLN